MATVSDDRGDADPSSTILAEAETFLGWWLDALRETLDQLQRQAIMENTLPPPKTQADCELADRLETLRDHLKEIHEAERREQSQLESVLGVRISRLWKRLEY